MFESPESQNVVFSQQRVTEQFGNKHYLMWMGLILPKLYQSREILKMELFTEVFIDNSRQL